MSPTHFQTDSLTLDETAGSAKTITEAKFCQIVGISKSTALALRNANKLAHCKVGRRVLYIYPRHVEEFLASVERKSSNSLSTKAA